MGRSAHEFEPDEESGIHDDGEAGSGPDSLIARLWPFAVVLAIGIFVLVPKLGDFGFWDPWEPKYAQASREMVERDSYIVPYYRDEVRLTKPILVYWGVLAGAAIFGFNEFGARIGGVSMALAAMLGVYYAVALLRGRTAGLLAAAVLGTLPQFVFLARQAMPDAYLQTSMGCALVFFALGLFGPDRRRNVHFGIAYACLGLAVLAKGPMVAGLVFGTTLAVYTAVKIDFPRLWASSIRLETVRLAIAGIGGVALLVAASATAFLFGTSPRWWGYSDEGREEVAEFQGRLLETAIQYRLAEVGLVVVLLLSVLALYLLYRGKVEWPRRLRTAGSIAAGAAALTAAGALFTDFVSRKLFIASVLVIGATAVILFFSVRRYLLHPDIRSDVQPLLGPIARQLLLFAGVFAVVAGPWHLGIFIKADQGYFTDFIIKHNVGRVADKINNAGDTSFYLRVLVFGLFPWISILPFAFATGVGWRERNPLKRYGFEAFLIIASVVTFAAFTSSATKFAHYISPILIPLAVLIGLGLHRLLNSRSTGITRLTWLTAAMVFALPALDIVGAEGAKTLLRTFTQKRWVPDDAEPGTYFTVLCASFFLLLLCSALVRSRILVAGLVVSAALMGSWENARFIPEVSRHKTMKHLCESWKNLRRGEEPIGMYGGTKHGTYFYTNLRIEWVSGGSSGFLRFMDPSRRTFCIVEKEKLPAVKPLYRRRFPDAELYVVNNTHSRYVLLSNHPVSGHPDTLSGFDLSEED